MRNVTPNQKRLLDQLRRVDPEMQITWDDARGVAARLRGNLARPSGSGAEPDDTLRRFVSEYGELFGPADLMRSLRKLRSRGDDLGWTHIAYFQTYSTAAMRERQEAPLEVYSAKFAAHFLPDGSLKQVNSGCWRDLRVDRESRITLEELRERLRKQIEDVPGFAELRDRLEGQEAYFPMTDPPRLVIFYWKGIFRPTWTSYGYAEGDIPTTEDGTTSIRRLTFGQLFVDATTGELLLFAPTIQNAETADTGSGLAVTPIGGPYTTRRLNIVRIDDSSTYRLKDTTHDRDIVTYDVACDTAYNMDYEIEPAIKNSTLPVSEDTDGDKTWNRLPSRTVNRTDGQQPEVDAHYFAQQQYEWYYALAGRKGWDDDNYPNPPVPPQTINVLAHCRQTDDGLGNPGSCNAVNAYCWQKKSGGVWTFWLAFMDSDGSTTEYRAGAHFTVAHEYQHAVTHFSFIDGNNDPGLDSTGWLGAVHEGLSDTFAALSTGQWLKSIDISLASPPQADRNLSYPRAFGDYLDHFDDRNGTTNKYARGTILAHCAYLMGQGGVHQRSSRTPELIPVYSMGRETRNGKDFLKASRIWYRALTYYFSDFGEGNSTGDPSNDESAFRALRNACVDAAEDIYGEDSNEYRTTILAFYAVGLQPVGQVYGPDVTFLRGHVHWSLSEPYLGLPTTHRSYSSLDLFINNGGISEWNAQIDFENTMYCRVRNVGDREARDIRVRFEYSKFITDIGTRDWQPVEDQDGNVQVLNVGNLAAGQSNFPDSDQDSPPASASVKWYVPPIEEGEEVTHWCVKAIVECSNDVNPFNNEVVSNIFYTPYKDSLKIPFYVGNFNKQQSLVPLKLDIQSTFPKGWKARIVEPIEGVMLRPGEERLLHLQIETRPDADKRLEPPFDGNVWGQMSGALSGNFTGTLRETVGDSRHLQGTLAARLEDVGIIVGRFEGRLDVLTGELRGNLTGTFQSVGRPGNEIMSVGIIAGLRPTRGVDIAQFINNSPVGGVSIQVQVPMPSGSWEIELPPTDPFFSSTRPPVFPPSEPPSVVGRVVRLLYNSRGDFTGFVLAAYPERPLGRPEEFTFYADKVTIERVVREAWKERWMIRVVLDPENPKQISHIELES